MLLDSGLSDEFHNFTTKCIFMNFFVLSPFGIVVVMFQCIYSGRKVNEVEEVISHQFPVVFKGIRIVKKN